MLRRNGVGASTSLTPVAHAEDAQPNEVSKKRKGQGLPPIVASSKPPGRTSYYHRGRGGATIRGGYRGGRETDSDASTQYATRGGKSSWRGHRNPSGSWPRRADSAFSSPHDPSSTRRPALPTALPPTAQTGIDKGKAPIRGGEQSMNKSWHRKDGLTTHSDTQRDKRVSPWGQQPDSGYGQRAVSRPTAPPKLDGPSQAPSSHCNPVHPSLPAKPPSQSSPQSPPQFSSYLSQPGTQESTASGATTEWYMRIGSPDPKIPPGSLARKNSQPQSTISMPLPGRLRKLQEKQDAREAAENALPIPPQPEPVPSFPVAAPVPQKPQPKPELSQVPLPPGKPEIPLPKHHTTELVKTANESLTENLPFVPPEDGSNTVPLSESRKARSKPRDVLPAPPQDGSTVYRSEPLPQQNKAPPQPKHTIKPPFNSSPTSLPLSQPPRQSKSAVSLVVKSSEMDALSFLPPQGTSGAYVPVPLSLQRQSRIPLYAMSPMPEPVTNEPKPSIVKPPAPLSQQRKSQSDLSISSKPEAPVRVDPNRSSRDVSRVVTELTPARGQVQAPEPNMRPQAEAELEGTLKSDDVLSENIAATRMAASHSLPPIETLPYLSEIGSSPSDGPVALPPSEPSPSTHAPPVTPKKTQSVQAANMSLAIKTRTGAHSPEVVIKKEQVSPLSRSPIKPTRKLVTEAANFYPMPASCDKAVPAYKENRKAFFKENSKILSALGLKRTKAFFRDDGLVIEWKSDVPVWSDTLKPEENNLATAMEEFLRRSAERSGGKRKRKVIQERDGREPSSPESPGAKRIKTSRVADPLSPSERKRKPTQSEYTLFSEKRRKTTAAMSSAVSGRLASSSGSKSNGHTPIATNHPLGLFPGDATTSKDEPIYIASSPESSPNPTSKPLPSAIAKKVPLPTRLHVAQNGALAFAPSTSTSNSKSTAPMSTGAIDVDSEPVKLPARPSIDPAETVPLAVSQSGVRAFAVGPPPSSRRMVFKPTNPSRTSRVAPTTYVSASAPSIEERGIEQHSASVVEITDSTSLAAPGLSGGNLDGQSMSRAYSPILSNDALLPAQKEVKDHNLPSHKIANGSASLNKPLANETATNSIGDAECQVLKDGDFDIYCSEPEEDIEDEDNDSKLAVHFFTRFITLFDFDRSKLVSAYAKNALFTCRIHDFRPHSTSMAEHFAPESKLVFHSYHSNAWASTVDHGRSRICDRLRAMGPHKFRALPGSVVWDLAPLPFDPPGHLMFSVHGEVVDPSCADRHLNHILTVDQTFVLRPRTDDDNSHEEELLSDSLHDDEEWPLVAVSHQMTVRGSRLLPPDAIEDLLPWIANVES